MPTDNHLKFISAVCLFAVWGGLVIAHFTPAEPFVSAIGMALTGLGVYHARNKE